jgi:predicted phage tail component-like protein
MIGFFFNNRHSKEFYMAMETAGRGLLPSLRRNDYIITGRHGTVNYGNETYNTRQIRVDIAFLTDNLPDLQLLARNIAYWLSGKGILYFDDEPDKAYDAQIYEAVDTAQLITAKRASVVFECQPFAKSIYYLQNNYVGTASGEAMSLTSEGTQPTPCIIYLRNTGSSNINSITVTRKAVKR